MGRAPGSLFKQAASSGRRSPGTPARSGSRVEMEYRSAGIVAPPKARRPVAANAIVQAQLNTSDARLGGCPANCSGAM